MSKQRVVVITGIAGGIGAATAQAFAAEGWHVVGTDVQQPATALAGVARFVPADVSDEGAMQHLFGEITRHEGRIDALVNNAAMQICKPLVETTLDEWETVVGVNLRSVYLAVRHAYPLLTQSDAGAIVNISSVHAIATSTNIAAYAATKGAMMALTRALAIELAPDHIRVNAVLPGAVDTPMLHAGLRRGHLADADLEASKQRLAERTVIGRVGTPDEIAQTILFLADTNRSAFVTGQGLLVDGGATARLSTE